MAVNRKNNKKNIIRRKRKGILSKLLGHLFCVMHNPKKKCANASNKKCSTARKTTKRTTTKRRVSRGKVTKINAKRKTSKRKAA